MKYLLVIDMQNDFVDGVLGTKEAQAIVPYVREKIKQRRKEGYRVIFTRDTHFDNYSDTQEGKKLPFPHCIHKTNGWQIVDGLTQANDEIIDKFSFGYYDWPRELKNIDEIELIGLCTDICVVSNALVLKTNFPEVPIKVDPKACAGVTVDSHDAALLTMKMCQIEVEE